MVNELHKSADETKNEYPNCRALRVGLWVAELAPIRLAHHRYICRGPTVEIHLWFAPRPRLSSNNLMYVTEEIPTTKVKLINFDEAIE